MENRPVSPSASDVPFSSQVPRYGPVTERSKQESYGDSEPVLFHSSTSYDHGSLKCDEDAASLEVHVPCHRDSPGGFTIASGRMNADFHADDTRDVIRNELSKLEELRYMPELQDAKYFADRNRPRLISWLVQVVTALDLTRETLHCAVSLLDRFISGTEAHPPEPVLQLLALGCLSTAAKHEEVAQRSPDEWVSLAVDNDRRLLYELMDLHRMEWLLMETVEWRVRVPNTFVFLRHYHSVLEYRGLIPADPSVATSFRACAEMMAEVSMLYSEFLMFGYSTVAVACLTLAQWSCQCTVAAGVQLDGFPDPTVEGARSVVSELAAFAALEPSYIAPGLGRCVELMSHLYRLITGWGSWGGPSASELGLLAPVVSRYQHK